MDALRAEAASILLLFAISPFSGQENDPARISVDVNLVVLHATVTDDRGHMVVSYLAERNFQVYEDGVVRELAFWWITAEA